MVCNAHHLRELEAPVEHDNEDRAHWMQQLLRRTNRVAHLARESEIEISQSLAALIKRRVEQILETVIRHQESLPPLRNKLVPWRTSKARRKGHNLALCLRRRMQAALRFVRDLKEPFPNNQAGRDLRVMKLRRSRERPPRSRGHRTLRHSTVCCRRQVCEKRIGSRRCCKGRTPCSQRSRPHGPPECDLVPTSSLSRRGSTSQRSISPSFGSDPCRLDSWAATPANGLSCPKTMHNMR